MSFLPLLALSFCIAWASRRALRNDKGGGSCNIGTNGRMTRFLIAGVLLGAGYALDQPLLTLCGGFALYEAFAGWCAFVGLLRR
jgi:hypothetical protein